MGLVTTCRVGVDFETMMVLFQSIWISGCGICAEAARGAPKSPNKRREGTVVFTVRLSNVRFLEKMTRRYYSAAGNVSNAI